MYCFYCCGWGGVDGRSCFASQLGSREALQLASGMGGYVWARAERLRASTSDAFWREFLAYEVATSLRSPRLMLANASAPFLPMTAGGSSFSDLHGTRPRDGQREVRLFPISTLAALTTPPPPHSLPSPRSWLDAAALFNRVCFTGPLEIAGAQHHASSSARLEAAWGEQSEEERLTAGQAMRGMHANAQLAFVLGKAVAYEATGEGRARRGVEAFWRQLQAAYTYLAGGSSFQVSTPSDLPI